MKIETETAGATVWTVKCDTETIGVLDDYEATEVEVWWKQVGPSSCHDIIVSSSQCSPQPVTYVVLISSEPILGRLALVPAGDHCTIPSSAYENKAQWFPQGKCDANSSARAGNKFIFYEYEGTSVAIRQTNLNMIFMLIKRC